MSIISVVASQTGTVSVLPSIAYIQTTDPVATVTTAGYLNKEVANGVQFSLPCIAVVSTKETPTSIAQVGWYEVQHVGANWSLDAGSNTAIGLTNGHIFVGNASNIATDVAMTGDITITNTGVTAIAAGVIVNADISASAAIAYSKLASMATGNLLIGNAGVPTSTALSGDATIGATGILTIANNAITTAKILNSNVTLAKLAAGITPAYIIKLGGKDVSGGGSATVTITATGTVATDLAFAAIQASANSVSIQKVTAGTDQVIVLCSGDPGAATICWEAHRAAA